MKIERSLPRHSSTLTKLAKASKMYWNYPDHYLKIWDADLEITEEYLINSEVFHLIDENDEICGFYSYFFDEENVRLEHLFILPKFIGRKLGDLLIKDFLQKIEKSGYDSIILDADPNAVGFYERYGFMVTEWNDSAIENRKLPVMVKKIDSYEN